MLAALELRDRFPELPITEAHPKALRWLAPSLLNIEARSEHERDAMLATVSAWGAYKRPSDWEDLFAHEENAFTPVSMPILYMMPNVSDVRLERESQTGPDYGESVTGVIMVANDVFGSKAKAMLWLNSPRHDLHERTPMANLNSVKGRHKVLTMLTRIAHGVYD